MIRSALTLLLASFAGVIMAQTRQIDSLKNIIARAGDDTIKVNSLNRLALQLRNSDADTAIVLIAHGMKLAQQLNYEWGLCKLSMTLGLVHYARGDFKDALMSYDKALEICERVEKSADHRIARNAVVSQKARIIGNIGLTHHAQGNYTRSLECFLNALHLAEKEHLALDTWYSNIGMVYDVQGEYEKAIDYYKRALIINEREGNISMLIRNYGNLGIVYDEMGRDTLALEYYFKALALTDKTLDMKSKSVNLSNIGVVYQNRGDTKRALDYFLQALKISEELGEKFGTAVRLNNIGAIYLAEKKYAMAEDYLSRSLKLSDEIGDLEGVSECSGNLSKLYEATGRYEKAIEFYKKYIAARDTIYNEDNTKNQVRLEMGYEFQKKEAAAQAEQEKKEVLARAEAKRQRIILFSISGFGLLVLIFAVFAYRSFLQKKRANEEISRQKELIEEKQKEILDSIYYARRIQRSLLTSEKYIQRSLTGLTNPALRANNL